MDDFGTPDSEIDTQPTPPSDQAPETPPADPYSLGSLTFADLPRQPGGGVMRQMAANGHPGLQAWAARDRAQNASNHELKPGVTISDALGAKVEPIAALVRDAVGRPMVITSTLRTPKAQAQAMLDNWYRNTPPSYANKEAAQIKDAYLQAQAAGKSRNEIVSAMQAQIERQMSRGVYVSRHLVDGGLDVRIKDASGQSDPVLRDAIIESAKAHGATVYPETSHLHIQPK